MSNIVISKLPEFEGKEILVEATERGLEYSKKHDLGIGGTSEVVLLGLVQIIAEMKEKLNSEKCNCWPTCR